MHTRLILPISLAGQLILGLCIAPDGQATSAMTQYTLTTTDGLRFTPSPTPTPTTPAATPTVTPAPQPFTLVPDPTYGVVGNVRYVRIRSTDCANLTASPIVLGDWLVYPNHAHSRNCSGPGPYRHALFGYNLRDGKLYILRHDGAGEAPLLYQPDRDMLYWTTTFGGTVFLLDPQSFALRKKVSVQTTSDSGGVYLDGLYYSGTVNTPGDNCQNPINENCGAVFAIDAQGNVVHTLNTDDGFRAWLGTSLTTDGEYLYIGSAKQTRGQEGVEGKYLYGCSVIKADKQLNILASFDPGDLACYYLPYMGANADSVAGEVVPDGTGLWVQYVRPNEEPETARQFKVALYRLNTDLEEQCRVEFPFEPQTQAGGFYAAPTVDSEGHAYVPVSVPDAQATRKGQLWKVTPTCRATLLSEAPGSFAHASPTLADVPPVGVAPGGYVLFATDGKLQLLTLAGDLVREYALASDARVLTSPVIHDGVIYVVQEDGTLNIIEDAGVTGYGDALWPRYRHDDRGSGALEVTATAPAPSPTPVAPQCVRDVNANGGGEAVDIMATASDLPNRAYLPLVAAQGRQSWLTPTPTPPPTDTPTALRFPRLHANFFSRAPENEAAYDALSRYGAVTTGTIYSNGDEGGYDLGVRQGLGSWSDTTYNLSNAGHSPLSQVTVYQAKKRNPNLTTLAHRGLQHIEALRFGYGTNSPQRWFADRLSPRWFAYTPLIELQEPVTRTSRFTFRFRPEDVQQWRAWGVRGGEELGLTHWRPSNRYDWYYLSFFDNEAGAGRGTVEIMAIQRLNAETGEVTAAVKLVNGKPRRTIYGRPQRYPAGSRAGIVPHSAEHFGAPAFLMNRFCLDGEPSGCEELEVNGVDWVDAAVEYVREILLPSRYPLDAPDETWLVDGVLMDADDDDWKPYGFRLGDPTARQGYHLDLNLDGQVDDLATVEARVPIVYEEYARRLKEAAAAMGRDLYVIKNGEFNTLPRPYHNGRQFEDFNGGFQESYPEAVRQYVDLFAAGNLAEPVYVLVRERDRNALYKHNFAEHRHIMALTLVLGDGFYGHTGAHTTRILDLYEDPSGWAGQPEDWFDEFSVDPYGYAADHPLYTGSGRSDYLGWLGRPLGRGYEVPDVPGVYRRDFEHGVAVYSLRGGTVTFDPPLRRICGVDPGNDGSLVAELTLEPRSGVVLRRDEGTGVCP